MSGDDPRAAAVVQLRDCWRQAPAVDALSAEADYGAILLMCRATRAALSGRSPGADDRSNGMDLQRLMEPRRLSRHHRRARLTEAIKRARPGVLHDQL